MYDICCIPNNGVVPMTRCGDRPVDRRASARAGPCESRADGKGAALRHRQGDFSGLPFRRSC